VASVLPVPPPIWCPRTPPDDGAAHQADCTAFALLFDLLHGYHLAAFGAGRFGRNRLPAGRQLGIGRSDGLVMLALGIAFALHAGCGIGLCIADFLVTGQARLGLFEVGVVLRLGRHGGRRGAGG